MQKISGLTLAERDDYVCRQSIAVLQVSGYDMPLGVALDYLLDSEGQGGYQFDVLDCVFNCISFILEHKHGDTEVKEAMENMLLQVGAEHVHRLTDRLLRIAEAAAADIILPIMEA